MLSSHGHAVALLVEALCYKPEGRGFESDEIIKFLFSLPNPSNRIKPWALLSL
jgi:hypothetical protein